MAHNKRAQEDLERIIRDIKQTDDKELCRKFEYESKEKRGLKETIDWVSYSTAQLREIDNFLVLVRNMTEEASGELWPLINPKGREGRPSKSACDRAKAILIQQYFMATDMLTAGIMWFLREKLDVREELTPKDIERSYNDPAVIAILMEIFCMTNGPARSRETEFSIDGTGMPTSIKQNYANDRSDEKKKATYEMLIGMVGVHTKLFTAAAMQGPGSESPCLPPLLEETASLYDEINLVNGDAGYLSRENCRAIAEKGAIPRIFPKTGITLDAKGVFAYTKMLLALISDPQKWLEDYHKRSISESVNSSFKRKFLRPLSRRIDARRNVEAYARVVAYNIRRLSYLHYLQDMEILWLEAS